jgi:hypothetical protein
MELVIDEILRACSLMDGGFIQSCTNMQGREKTYTLG